MTAVLPRSLFGKVAISATASCAIGDQQVIDQVAVEAKRGDSAPRRPRRVGLDFACIVRGSIETIGVGGDTNGCSGEPRYAYGFAEESYDSHYY